MTPASQSPTSGREGQNREENSNSQHGSGSGGSLGVTAVAEGVDNTEEGLNKIEEELPSLRSEIATLAQTLADLSVEESAVTDQVRSLKYALQLTRGEVERRQRANSELHTAYNTSNLNSAQSQSFSLSSIPTMSLDTFATQTVVTADAGMSTTTPFVNSSRDALNRWTLDEKNEKSNVQRNGNEGNGVSLEKTKSLGLSTEMQQEEVQRLEGELLNAKRDAANAVFEVETLSLRLKRLRERVGGTPQVASPKPTGSGHAHSVDGRMRSPVENIGIAMGLPASSSPRNTGSTRATASPSTRAARLIGDVDALIGFSGNRFIPGRLGVAASGRLALYSYASGDAIVNVDLDDDDRVVHPLGEEERDHVEKSLLARRIRLGRGGGDTGSENGDHRVLCGLGEAISAAAVLMADYATKEWEAV